MKKQLYTLGFFLSVLSFFNLIGLIAFSFYPNEVYQKYLLKKEDGVIIQKQNGFGAMGDMYQGQPFKIAFFGSSILESNDLNFNDKISQRLKQILGQNKVHVDNFAIGWSHITSSLSQMKSLKRRGYRYDIVLFSLGLYYEGEDFRQYTFHFSKRWFAEDKILAIPSQIKKFFNRHREREKLLRLFYKEETEYQRAQRNLLKALNGEDVIDGKIRQLLTIQTRLADVPLRSHNIKKAKKEIGYRIKKITQVAKKITDKIYWAPIRVAYHSNIPSDLYVTIKPHWKFQKNNPKFYNAKSLYQNFAFHAENEIDIVKKAGIKVLDYSKFVESYYDNPETPYWENPKELYLDEYHFSAKGSLLIAEFLAKEFQPLVAEKIKNQNK